MAHQKILKIDSFMRYRFFMYSRLLILFVLILTGCKKDESAIDLARYTGTGSVTQGKALFTVTNLLTCTGARVSSVGTITSTDKKIWTVPGEVSYTTAAKAKDMYNSCNSVTYSNISQVNVNSVPVVQIDPDGETITGYIFSDNYFELYINDVLVAVDPVPYTPFNSSVVRFKVKKPYTIAFKAIDWEENLGLGTENGSGDPFHSGDGGFIAAFSDGTKTDASWKVQTYYIAPIEDLSKLTEEADGTRASSSSVDNPACEADCYAIHWEIPASWTSKSFTDSGWPFASEYTAQKVGVDHHPAYMNFSSVWANASFIWTSNIVLDNVVLARKTVK